MFSKKLYTTLTALVLLATTQVHNVLAGDCIVPHNDDGSDDSPAILAAFEECREDSTITFEPVEYAAHTPISFVDLRNVTVYLNGNIALPSNITQVQQAINATLNRPSTYATPWFYFQGEDVSIIGSDDFEFGRFIGHGEQWWHQGNRILRPQLATFNVTNGFLRNLKVIKPIAWGWNLPGTNIRVENHFVDAKPENATRSDTTSFPFNTDGFNLSGNNITVDGYYGHNGDDCISVINGARNIVAQNGYCGFSSHGLSIGSLGRNGAEHTVENVLFRNWTMEGAVYGARFKSWTGGRGYARDITWEDITLVNVSTAIFITQNYYDQDKGPRPENTNQSSTEISNFRFNHFHGTLASNWTDGTCISDPCWNYIEGIDNTRAIIFDLYPGTSQNITVENVDDIRPWNGERSDTNVLCNPEALSEGEQDTLGFQCHNGAFQITEIQEDSAAGLTARVVGWTGLGAAVALTLTALGL